MDSKINNTYPLTEHIKASFLTFSAILSDDEMTSKSHLSPLRLQQAPGQLSTRPHLWFLGHKLWQESRWLSCPISSTVPHTHTCKHTHWCSAGNTQDLLTTGSVGFLRQHYLSRARQWAQCRKEKKGRKKGQKMKEEQWERKTEEEKASMVRVSAGKERQRDGQRQRRKAIFLKVWRSESDSLTTLRQRWMHTLAPAVCAGMKDEHDFSIDLKGGWRNC